MDRLEEQFNQLADNLRDVLWLYPADYSSVIYISPAYERVWGRTRESLQQNPYSFLDAVHPEDRARVEKVIRNEHERGFDLQYRIIRPDGEVRWIWDRGFPVSDAEGRVYRVAGIAEDITDRRKTEEELQRVSERLQLATTAARIGIWDWDMVRDELVWDDQMYSLYGIPRERFGQAYDAWAKSVAPGDFERVEADLQAALRGEREYAPEFRVLWPDGSTHFIKAAAQIFRDESGRPVRMVGLNYDITERKLAEERILLLQTITMDVAAAEDVLSALKVVLRRVCEKTGWALGQAWIPRQDRAGLDCCPAWFASRPGPSLKAFRVLSSDIILAPGHGLPGRVHASKQPAWIRDVTQDANFPRAAAAREAGLKAALAVPILSGDEVIAILEFFLSEPREEDERLVQVISAVAAQIGLVIERKRAEEKLRWSEERLRLLLDSTAEGIFGVDLQGRCTFCNASSLRLLGYDDPSELLGRDMHALIAHSRADGTPYPMTECPVVQSLHSATNVFSDADVFWRKDGALFPAEYWSYPMFREGTHIGAVVTFLDITERKLANESLRLSEERFLKAFQASPEPITIFRHRDGVMLEVNERWQAVYGYSGDEAVGRTSLDLRLIQPDDRERLRGLLEKQHSVREFEVDLRTKDDEIRHISLSAEQIVINNELCNIFLHHDVTDARRAEEEAARHRDELVRADKMVSLGTLVSGLAHEISNPNHSIALNVPLVREAWREVSAALDEVARADLRIARMPWTEARGEVAAMLDDVEHASERIRCLLTDLRSFALDHDPGDHHDVAVNDVVRGALRLLGNHIAKATRHFETELPTGIPLIRGSARRLEQVVINLVLNACQALRNDQESIHLSTGFDGQRAFIRVRDEGRGIAPEHLASVRTPFFTTKRTEGGTGLGVPVSDRIANEHGGELTFESAPGRGTTATLWLPVRRGP